MINKRKFLGIPLVRRNARRWFLVGYWASVVALVSAAAFSLRKDGTFFGGPPEWPFMLIGIVMANLLGGDGNRGPVRVGDGVEPANPGDTDFTFMTDSDIAAKKQAAKEARIDEREVGLRNLAHYRAYSVFRWVMLACFFLLLDQNLRVPLPEREAIVTVIFLGFWGLPPTIILWTEPDMEEPS